MRWEIKGEGEVTWEVQEYLLAARERLAQVEGADHHLLAVAGVAPLDPHALLPDVRRLVARLEVLERLPALSTARAT